MKYIKLSREGHGSYINTFDEICAAIDGELASAKEDAEVGDKITLEVVEMTEEEFAALPEFEGH